MEYVIQITGQPERYLCIGSTGVQTTALQFASVFKSRDRAQALAVKHNGKVELFLGKAQPQGSKFFTVPKQSPINRRSAYRNI